jgi:ferredoxin
MCIACGACNHAQVDVGEKHQAQVSGVTVTVLKLCVLSKRRQRRAEGISPRA